MPKLHELQERRAHAVSEMQTINEKAETENRDYNTAEDKRHRELKTELAGLDKQIQRAADLQEATRSAPAILHHGRGDGNFDNECRSYSLCKAIAHQAGMRVDAGREIEISSELERRGGRQAQGILAPMSVFEKRADVVTTTQPSAGVGGNLIATDLLAGQYIDILRDSLAVQRLGARVLSGLVGNVDVPRLKQSATAMWVAENAAITASDLQFDKVQLTPKHVGAIVEVSRNMLQQSSPGIESILRDDFAALIARGIDRVAIQGGDTDEPSGVLDNASDVNDLSAVAGAPLTYEDVVALIGAVAGSNALQGSLGFLTNSAVTTLAATTLRSSADTSSNFILDPGDGTLAGYPLAISNLVPSNLGAPAPANLSAIIFANWSDLLIAYWSAFDLLANPYESTAFGKGNLLVRAMATCDVALRQPKSFAIMMSLTTTTGGT